MSATYFLTIATSEGGRSQGFGVISMGDGLSCSTSFAIDEAVGPLRLLSLVDYPRGVEPLFGLVGRFLAILAAQERGVSDVSPTFASVSIYRHAEACDTQPVELVEHLVVKRRGASIEAELCDEFEESTVASATSTCSSSVDLVEQGIRALLWHGGEPEATSSLSQVPVVREELQEGQVLERTVPPYARRRFTHWLGGFRGPTADAFFAADWEGYLASVGSD